MGASIWPVTDDFVAEVGDVDLSRPLSDADWHNIEGAYHRYGVLVFPDQHLSQEQHVAFARRFGEIDRSMVAAMNVDGTRIPPDIADVSNLDPDGNVMGADDRLNQFQRGNRLWHTDSSFKDVPANASLLYLRSIPPVGGQTEFADARAAWDAAPEDLRRRLEGRIALHSIAVSRAKLGFTMTAEENARYPLVPQAVVRTHRISGRRSIYLASHAGRIVDMDEADGRALIDEAMAWATQRRFVHTHRWRVNDLVVWDNRCVLHRGRPFDDARWPRDAQRATSLDVANTVVQEGLELRTPITATT
ncbi:MAG: TauD/TfdA dioxygenase family protein [Acidimicrobiia bacterium]